MMTYLRFKTVSCDHCIVLEDSRFDLVESEVYITGFFIDYRRYECKCEALIDTHKNTITVYVFDGREPETYEYAIKSWTIGSE